MHGSISCLLHCPTNCFSFGSLILGTQIVHDYEDEVKLTLPTTKNNCSLYLHHHHHHHDICIVFLPPLPTHHFYNNCFHTTTITFLLFSLHHDNHHHFSTFSLHHYHHHHHHCTNSETFIDLQITSQENLSNSLNHFKKIAHDHILMRFLCLLFMR